MRERYIRLSEMPHRAGRLAISLILPGIDSRRFRQRTRYIRILRRFSRHARVDAQHARPPVSPT